MKRAQEQTLEIDYRVGDCERLDLDDAAYDRLSSAFGIMFAPDHAATAHELARVVAPADRIALASWTPESGVGQLFMMMRPFLPTPPPGAGSPFAWGREEVVRELLGNAFELDIEERVSILDVPTGEDYWQLFSSSYGPTKTAAEALDEDRRDQFHQTWVDFFDSRHRSDAGGVSHPRKYLLVVGKRR